MSEPITQREQIRHFIAARFPDLALSDDYISSIAAMPVASYVCERGLRDVNVFLNGLPKAHGVS